MAQYRFHLVNVFAETTLGGNPLCVFEDAGGLDGATMQALALQFNLSETTFLLPSDAADRRMRIFTPAYEMDFAGHPTLGSAYLVGHSLGKTEVHLETNVGVVPVCAQADRWTFQVPKRNGPLTRRAETDLATLAAALGIPEQDIAGPPLYVNTGNEQLIVPLASRVAVMRARPRAELLRSHVQTVENRCMVYLFAPDGEGRIVSRFFFQTATGLSEDPGTGSACANLGAYLLEAGAAAPFERLIDQGEMTGRRCSLSLRVDAQGTIFVGGRCLRLGGGTVEL